MNRILTILFVLACLHFGWKHFKGDNAGLASGGAMTDERLAQLASQVRPGDIVMYSTTQCSYCAQAKGWLSQYGFQFTECNMTVERRCEREFLSYGGNGTPYLVVKGHHMKNGFDSDEFLAALQH